jgi:predicted HD phosphohydrolase
MKDINSLPKEEVQKAMMEHDLDDFIRNYGATETAQIISDSATQSQSRIIIDKLVILHGKKWGERLFQ